jgi:beta-lactamase regulating signal transducer with metallopeptidase domain
MNLALWLDNLAAYSLQIGLLTAAGTLLPHILRIRMPAVLLRYWQVLLMACLFLPALQPWRQTVLQPSPVVSGPLMPASPVAVRRGGRATPFPSYNSVALILAAGIGFRLLWLLMGLLRLSSYRRNSRLLAGLPSAVEEMRMRVGGRPEIYISNEISGPVTFGFGRGAILFPAAFLEMEEKLQRPIACHELLHVRRADWLSVVLEDALCAVFWFHPAVWWAVGRIRLYRKQTVDSEVLAMTAERKSYLESLVHFASIRNRPTTVPAPLFLRECHLAQRVALMMQEVAMSRTRLLVSLSVVIVFLLCTARLASAWFPLSSPAILQPGSQQEAKIIAIRCRARQSAHGSKGDALDF